MEKRTEYPLFVTEVYEVHIGRWGEFPEDQYLVLNINTGVCEYADTRWVYAKNYAVGMTDEIIRQNHEVVPEHEVD